MTDKYEEMLNLIANNRTENSYNEVPVWKNKNKTDNKE